MTGHGGQDRSLLELVEALAAREHDVRVTYRVPGPFLERYVAAGVDPMRVGRYMIPPSDPWHGAVRFASAVAKGWKVDADVVYLNQLTDSPWGAAVSLLRGAPLVCHLRLPPPMRFGVQWMLALRAVTRFVSVSAFTKAQHVEAGLDEDAIDVVPNGVDLGHYRPPQGDERALARSTFGEQTDAPIALYLGRLDVGKGLETLLSAWPEVRRADPEARLVVAGAAQFHEGGRQAARRYADDLRERTAADPSVVWVGHHGDVLPLLWAADVVVVPSEWPEPSARSILEAMACGVPVVVSDAGGMPEFLPAGQRPFQAGDVGALAGQIRARLRWREDEPDAGDVVRRHVAGRFTLDETVEGILAVFTRALRTSRRDRWGHVHDLWSWGR